MRQFFFLILLICCLQQVVIAQTNRHTILIENLLADTLDVANISREENNYLSIQDKPFNELPQDLIKCRGELYVFLNGSGRLYKAFKEGEGIEFERVDTTRYFGYNGGSFAYSYNDTIYNLGGYGLWRINGQLRMYVEKTKQWDIVKLNQEIPIMYGRENTLLWFDQHEGKIYTGISSIRDEAVKDTGLNEAKFIYDVSVLDLKTKNWTKIGYLGAYLRNEIPNLANITSSPWGQLLFSGNKWLLIDFKNNKLLTLGPSRQKQITSTLAPHVGANAFYFKDSMLYAANSNVGRIDSFALSRADFVATHQTVYELVNESSTKNGIDYYLFFVLALMLAGAIWGLVIMRRRRKLRNVVQDDNATQHIQKGNGFHKIVFEARELQVLRLIYVNSASARNTTIDELNKALGLSKRNVEIQKKQRSDVITSINKKYHYINPETEIVLDKKRSEYDKRSFEYFIKFELLEEVSNLLEKVSLAQND